jgi:hypothetical protein
MSTIAACVILLLAMTALVVFSMAVENWTTLVQPLRPPAPDRAGTSGIPIDVLLEDLVPGPDGSVEPADADADADADGANLGDVTFVSAVPAPVAGDPDGAVRRTAGGLVVRDGATADVLAGLLFAAYGASRRAASDRAAAWVTAAATPPSLDRDRFPAGVDLRGRPARVGALLDATDGGVTWLTLRTEVDIALGLRRRPVTQATLSGLLSWWECTRSLPAVLDADGAGSLAAALGVVRDRLEDHPWVDVVDELAEACADAADHRTSLLVDVEAEVPASAQELDSRGSVGAS